MWGGPTVQGFAFIMLIGVMVGTYSSIFVASPAMIYLTRRRAEKREERIQAQVEAPKAPGKQKKKNKKKNKKKKRR